MAANTKPNLLSLLNSSFFNQSPAVVEVEIRDEDAENNLYQQILDHLLIDYMSLGEPKQARLREFVRSEEATPLTLRNVTSSLKSVLQAEDVNLYNKGDYIEVILSYEDNTVIDQLLTQFKPSDIPVINPDAFDWYFVNRNMDYDYILKYIFHQLGNYCLEHEMKFNDLFTVKGSIPIVVNTYINAPNLSAIIQHFQFPDARQVSITRNNELTDEDEGNKTTLQFNFSYKNITSITTLALHNSTILQA